MKCFCPKCIGVPEEWVKGWTVYDWVRTLEESGLGGQELVDYVECQRRLLRYEYLEEPLIAS